MKARRIALPALALAIAGAAAAQAPLRDPFARPAPAKPAAEEPRPQLRAIMFQPGRSLADINGRILAVGDRLGDYRVARIDARSVTLARGGAATVLALEREEK